MGVLFNIPWFYEFLVLFCTITFFIIIWMQNRYQHWNRLNVVHPKSRFFVGNFGDLVLQKEGFSEFVSKIYKFIKSKNKLFGGGYILFEPVFVPIDPELIKHIMVNDFQHFVDRGVYFNEDTDPLSAHLFSIEGTKWKILRGKLTPTFTSGKMKMMFEQLIKCSEELLMEIRRKTQPLDVKDILARFTTDIIGSCAFGIECNSLHDPDNEFRIYGKRIFENTFIENISNLFGFMAPNVSRLLGVRLLPVKSSEFFMNIVRRTVSYREKNNIYRKDFMHLLLQLKNNGDLTEDVHNLRTEKYKNSITLNELAAQAFVFFIAGFETSSTTMTFCLYELALNQNIQEKLRKEINEVLEKFDGKITYDALTQMSYMDNVINGKSVAVTI